MSVVLSWWDEVLLAAIAIILLMYGLLGQRVGVLWKNDEGKLEEWSVPLFPFSMLWFLGTALIIWL